MTSEALYAQGRVRGLQIGTGPAAGNYARIRLAGDPRYFMDFDDPDAWDGLKGKNVAITYREQFGSDGHEWRVVLDVQEVDDD